MQCVLTLVAPGEAPLTTETLDRAVAAIQACGGTPAAPEWLSDGEACDLLYEGEASPEVQAAVEQALSGRRVDLAVQASAGRRKEILVADMESTIIAQEMVDELAGELGIGPKVAEITARSMAGEIDFAASLRERVSLLKGLEVAVLDRVGERMTLHPGAKTLVATLRAHGVFCALVSGGFTLYADKIGAHCGFDDVRANRLLIEGGAVSGAVGEPLLGPDAKEAALKDFARQRGISLDRTCAVGDGANDLPMIAAAGLGVAYHGKPKVQAAARTRINHGDLTALLYFQGYRRNVFRH